MRRICPACATRQAQLVDEHCPVCDGHGTLELGQAALAIYDPLVVAHAVAITLEAEARQADLSLTLSDDRQAPLRQAVVTMTRGGLLARRAKPRPLPVTTVPRKRDQATGRYLPEGSPASLASEYTTTPVLPIDWTLPNAAPYRYRPDERPNARGLPLLSANGHPSHLARVTDPQPAGRETGAHVAAQRGQQAQARVLSAAAREAAGQRRG